MATSPDGMDERKALYKVQQFLLDKVNHIANQLDSYQYDLNNQVKRLPIGLTD